MHVTNATFSLSCRYTSEFSLQLKSRHDTLRRPGVSSANPLVQASQHTPSTCMHLQLDISPSRPVSSLPMEGRPYEARTL